MESLYTEVLYTISHKLGNNQTGCLASTGGCKPITAKDLYNFAKKAFNVSEEKHDELMSSASEEKVETYISVISSLFPNFTYIDPTSFVCP